MTVLEQLALRPSSCLSWRRPSDSREVNAESPPTAIAYVDINRVSFYTINDTYRLEAVYAKEVDFLPATIGSKLNVVRKTCPVNRRRGRCLLAEAFFRISHK